MRHEDSTEIRQRVVRLAVVSFQSVRACWLSRTSNPEIHRRLPARRFRIACSSRAIRLHGELLCFSPCRGDSAEYWSPRSLSFNLWIYRGIIHLWVADVAILGALMNRTWSKRCAEHGFAAPASSMSIRQHNTVVAVASAAVSGGAWPLSWGQSRRQE